MLITLALSLAMHIAPLTVEVRGIAPLPSSTPAAPQALVAAGQSLFTVRCQMCHGKGGDADTPMGKVMKPSPARFSDPLWQASTTDDEILEIVTLGGAALNKSPAMPAGKNLKPDELKALVAFVRQLRSPYGGARVTVTAGRKVVVASAAADASGVARVVVADVAGAANVVGVDSGGRACAVDVVSAAGAVVVCAAKP